MSWRWLVDVRGSEPKVDVPRLTVVVVVASLISTVLARVFSPVILLVVVLIAAPALIYVDVRMRREKPPD